MRADRRPGRDQRHERDRLGAAEPLADARARRPRAGDALGPGLAAGDRPRAVRAPAGQARRDRRRRRPRSPGWSTRRCDVARAPAHRARRSSTSRSTSCSWRPTARGAGDVAGAARAARADGGALDRARGAAARRRAAGDHGRHEPLLGPRRGRAARARRGARASRCSSTASRAAACPPTTSCSSRARAATGAEGRRRRARHRRADGLPARLRRRLRRGDRDRRDRRRRARARAPARRSPPSSTATSPETLRGARPAGGAGHRARGSASCAAIETEKRAAEREQLRDDRAPLHPMRVYGELAAGARPRRDRRRRRRRLRLLRRAASSTPTSPGCWLDPGPFGCLGCGPGLRARGQARAPRPPGRAAARRRRVRLLAGWSSTRWPATASTSSA